MVQPLLTKALDLGVPCLVNILELNINGGLQANFLSTGSAKQLTSLHFHLILLLECKSVLYT